MTAQRACLPVSKWPKSDRERWQRALRDKQLFKSASVAAGWRPRTVETVADGYGYALAWLDRQGGSCPEQPPTARWPAEMLRRYITDMQARLRPATILNRVLALERALAVISPEADRAIFRTAIRRLSAAPSSTDKRSRLQDPAQLVDLGHQLMNAAEADANANRRLNAALYRDGLQIALLALRAFRKRNFAGLQVGTHLVRVNAAWWLVLRGDETKTGQPIEVPFPDQLVPNLTRYLEYYRPLLAADPYRGDRLWVSYRFTAQSPHSIQLQIVAHTVRAFGKSINPHLFRDCVATSIAIHDPENVRMAATILGHRSFATTEKHYNLASTLEAGRSYAEVVAQRRAAAVHRSRRGTE